MTIARPQFLWAMALGIMISGLAATSALADPALSSAPVEDKAGHSHAAADKKTEYICPMHCVPPQKDPGRCSVCEMELVSAAPIKLEKEISKALAALDAADQKQAVAQRFCPIMLHTRLGATGTPHKVMVAGSPIFVCCKGCIEPAEEGGKKTLAMVQKLTKAAAAMAKMSVQDRTAAEAQKYCAIATKNFLGSMGAPIKLELDGKPVFLCCKGCVKKANANPAATLAKVEALKKAGEDDGHDHKEGSGHKHDDGHKH